MNRYLASLALLLFMVPSLRAERGQVPATLSVEVRSPLMLASQATRRDLLGAVELYTIALYTAEGTVSRETLTSPDVPKALRIQVSYEETLRRKLALDWRSELVPRLSLRRLRTSRTPSRPFSMATRSSSNMCRPEERRCG